MSKTNHMSSKDKPISWDSPFNSCFMIRSEIEFKCKQFWSNEQNKITAEVFPRDGKKAILKVPHHYCLPLGLQPVLLI